jgi:hypothetical protein
VQPGQALIAAVGGADRRPAQRRGRAVASIARSAPRRGCSAPRGCLARAGAPNSAPAVALTAARRSKGLPRSKHVHPIKPLTCGFAPLAGLEPATYGLEVDPRPSTPSPRMPFLLVRSDGSSSRCGPVTWCRAWRNDQRMTKVPFGGTYRHAQLNVPGRTASGWSRGHGSGVPPDAQRHPPGEGAAAALLVGCRPGDSEILGSLPIRGCAERAWCERRVASAGPRRCMRALPRSRLIRHWVLLFRLQRSRLLDWSRRLRLR